MLDNVARWHTRRAPAFVGLVLALVVSNLGVAAFARQDLSDRQHRLDNEIRRADRQLDQSSAALLRAQRRLWRGKAAQRRAMTDLAKARAREQAARLEHELAQSDLLDATDALRRVTTALQRARIRTSDEEDALRQFAVETVQRGDPALLALSSVLTSTDPAGLSDRLNAIDNVMAKESASLARLDATRALLDVQKQLRKQARERVAARESEAQRKLEQRRAAEQEAVMARDQLALAVKRLARQRASAAKIRAQDRAELRALRKERAKVAELLRQRAQRARRRATKAQLKRGEASVAWPVDGWVSSPFGMRFHPVFKRWSLHDGLDIASACGTPVRAAAAGRVIARYYNSAYGNRVIIDSGFLGGRSVATTYNHMSAFSAAVGERVQEGDVIGYVGTTGASTGCHLHFMVMENGTPVDPMPWL